MGDSPPATRKCLEPASIALPSLPAEGCVALDDIPALLEGLVAKMQSLRETGRREGQTQGSSLFYVGMEYKWWVYDRVMEDSVTSSL